MASAHLQNVCRAAHSTRSYEAILFLRQCRTRSLHSSINRHARRKPPLEQQQPQVRLRQLTAQRCLSTTATQRATVVTQNLRQDEDGNDMTITISDRAAKRLKQITSATPQRNTLAASAAATTPSDSHLRVSVTSGGCHGFQYLMSLEAADKIDQEEDTVFVASAENVKTADNAPPPLNSARESGDGGSARVVLDQSSLELLKGSTVDFTTELIGSQFKIVGNPRATSSCGCGTSFDIE